MAENPNEIRQAVNSWIDQKTSNIQTTLPGKIVSYDPDRNRAQVQPTGTYKVDDDRELAYPIIHEVPVIMPTAGGGSSGLTMPIEPGDGVILHFSQRELDTFLQPGSVSEDKRKHDMNDCIATIGLLSGTHEGAVAHKDGVAMSYKGNHFKLTSGVFECVVGGGKLSWDGTNLIVNGLNLTTHTHPDPQGGTVGAPE